MSGVATAPIYSVYSTYLDAGLTGGALLDFEGHAERAAAAAANLLMGRGPAVHGEAAVVPSRCVVDAGKATAFGLNLQALPAGCKLVGEPPSLWQQHRGAALTAGAVLVLQGATIGGLLWQRRRRRQAESDAVGHRLELASATRLAVMGELSAAIAHEIRQPLGAILSNAEAAELLLDADRPDLAQLREILADIRRDDLRAHEVIRRLRRLFQAQQVEHVPLSLHETLDEALRLLAPEALARGVHIERHFDAQHDVVLGDRIQLQQVLVNLVRNAMDAMEHLAPELRQLGVATAELAGGTVLRVSDAGHGIASAHRQRLFTSFFTTKPHGMGMGLSIVHSLVEAHQGTVHAETGNGRGAVFVVWLPLPAPADTSLLPAQPQPVRRAA